MSFIWKLSGFVVLLSIFVACSSTEMIEVKNDNGKVVEKYTSKKGNIKHGDYTAFYDNGKVRESAHYIEGKLEGERKIFYENGQMEISETYKEGVIDGDYSVFHINGQKKIEAQYSNGAMNGLLRKFSENGTLVEEVTMKDNEENGPFKEYHPNGKIQWEGTYLNGDNEFGLLQKYDEEGILIRKLRCDSQAVCRTFWTKEEGDITPVQ